MEMAKRVDSGVEKRIKKPSVRGKRRRRHDRSVLKKFVDYLKSDSYMFAPLLSRYPSDSHFLASNAVVSSSAAGVEFTEKGKREKKSLVEQVGNYLNSDSHLYAPLLAPHHRLSLSSKDNHRRMGIPSKKSAEEDMEGTVEKLGNAGDHIIRQQHKETIVKHMVCRSISASVQALHPPHHQSIVPLHNSTSIKLFDCKSNAPIPMEKSMKMDDSSDFKSLPPWKTNDVKSWIWMQQAMHPDLNYNRRTWLTWKMGGVKAKSIKKWIKERKQKRKEEDRLQKAQVHAAVSVAGIAAALAAIAADNSRKGEPKEDAVASAAALVATHCAKVAQSMGAQTDHLGSVLGSAFSASSASDILTLTAAASTSIRGAETLKARRGYKKMLNGNEAVLPIEDSNTINIDFDFERCKSILAHATQLHVHTPNGNFGIRSVSIYLNSQDQVILRMRKLNLLKTKKESIIMEVQAELYKDSSEEELERDGTCYLIVLTTNKGITKLDMGDDYNAYNTWATTINHLLTLSSSSFG